jgi:ribosomal protein S27AE
MFWIAILIAVLISAAAVAVVVWPLLKRGPAPLLIEDDALTDLLHRKDAVLAAIKETEFDYRVGKLSQEDYERIDSNLRRQAVGLLQQIEKIAPESARLDDDIEAAIAAQRQVQPERPATPAPRAKAVVAPRPVASLAPAKNGDVTARASFCTNCGGRVEAHHKFCASCGQPVAEVAPVA